MIKKITAAALGLALMITPAFALEQFYNVKSGQWSIEGYRGEKNFCSAKTYWYGPDGGESYMSLFNMKGTQTLSLMIHNTAWNMVGDRGSLYNTNVTFEGSAGNNILTGQFELYDYQTIIFRNITEAFLNDWITYRYMTVEMPGGIRGLKVGLTGTSVAEGELAACVVMQGGELGD